MPLSTRIAVTESGFQQIYAFSLLMSFTLNELISFGANDVHSFPRYLYVSATTACVYIGVSVVSLTAIYTSFVFAFRSRYVAVLHQR